MASLAINIKFTDRAGKLLQPGTAALSFQSLATTQQQLAVGDRLRMPDIPNCPWFVVLQRYWELGQDATLTIWLDEPQD
jgi:hypothetical protein